MHELATLAHVIVVEYIKIIQDRTSSLKESTNQLLLLPSHDIKENCQHYGFLKLNSEEHHLVRTGDKVEISFGPLEDFDSPANWRTSLLWNAEACNPIAISPGRA